MTDKKTKKAPLVGPIRHNLEAFGVAILAAVLLKWFCVEAYQIPTSSMQPTLMGSNEAAVYDRILVNKWIQTIREPHRWDITVFKYPLQKNQNYVKRIGGMPNDRIAIRGGNVYRVEGTGASAKYTVHRKPDDLQEDMWKNVFPLRMQARSESKALGDVFAASPSRAATETDDGFVLDPNGRKARLYFRDKTDGGMIDRVWDGYPAEVARQIREKNVGNGYQQEIVPDVRISADVSFDGTPDEFVIEVEVLRPALDLRSYALVARNGEGILEVRGKGQSSLGASEPFALAIDGTPRKVVFARVDDMLIASIDGDELQRFDCSEWPTLEGCKLPAGAEAPTNQRAIPQFRCTGKGKVTLANVRIDRDQHYQQDNAPDIIEVPDGHYYMLGDNTLQSIDSRGWTAITIGVDKDDNVVPHDSPEAVRTIRGNKRPMRLADAPDRDETPIAIPSKNAIVMIDEYGEILRLKGQVGADWPTRVSFRHPNAQDGSGEWDALDTTNTEGISFVPRRDIEGRALMVFYPFRPISWLFGSAWPDRFGFVR
ncbi:MAG: signal peptidase I [Planctomycetota bacterium]